MMILRDVFIGKQYKKYVAISFIVFPLMIVSGAILLISQMTSDSKTKQDVRSRASEISATPTLSPPQYTLVIKSPQSVNCLNNNLACYISPDQAYVGLYAPPQANCTTKIHCEQITAQYNTSCAVYDFATYYKAPISVRYAQTKQPIAKDSCEGSYCGQDPGLNIYTSQDKISWTFIKGLPGTSSDVFTKETIQPTSYFRYVMACRGGGGGARDNVKVEKIAVELSVDQRLAGKSFSFAEKYYGKSASDITGDYETLGFYDFNADGTVKINYYYYESAKNRMPVPSSQRHGSMVDNSGNTPPYAKACTPGYIQKPNYTSKKEFEGVWTKEGNILKVQIGTVIHEWSLYESDTNAYRLNRYYSLINGSADIGRTVISGAEGFGYLTDKSTSTEKLNKLQLANYSGDMYQKNGKESADWWYAGFGLATSVYRAVSDDVSSYSYSCPYYDTSGKFIDNWCEFSILLNDDPGNTNLIYYNGGHDFNMNGCLDETDHSYQLLGIRESGKVTKFVYVEYSWETDGYPITSIGRFYIPKPNQPVIKILKPDGNMVRKDNAYTISWTTQNATSDMKVGEILLWKGPYLIEKILTPNSSMTNLLPATGTYAWTPLSSYESRSDYTIRVLLYKNGKPITHMISPLFKLE